MVHIAVTKFSMLSKGGLASTEDSKALRNETHERKKKTRGEKTKNTCVCFFYFNRQNLPWILLLPILLLCSAVFLIVYTKINNLDHRLTKAKCQKIVWFKTLSIMKKREEISELCLASITLFRALLIFFGIYLVT